MTGVLRKEKLYPEMHTGGGSRAERHIKMKEKRLGEKTPWRHQLSKNIIKLPETKVEPHSRIHSALREPTLGRISKTVGQYTFLICESLSLGHFAMLDPEN